MFHQYISTWIIHLLWVKSSFLVYSGKERHTSGVDQTYSFRHSLSRQYCVRMYSYDFGGRIDTLQ